MWPFSRRSMSSRVRREVIRPTDGPRSLFGRPPAGFMVGCCPLECTEDGLQPGYDTAFAAVVAAEKRLRHEAALRALARYSTDFPSSVRPLSDASPYPWPGLVGPADDSKPSGGDQS